MKRTVLVFSLLLLMITSGCNNFSKPKISEDQARSIVLKEHTKHIGKVRIISVSHKGEKYSLKWENKEKCEHGTDYVNDQNGEITKRESSIC
ncbi:hypothetical protein A374_15132 [Fictibacillus macauensis ZFHKF-1]|uniref:Lipoprotein n=1 Tax=Fictibacillus macauensis ZFHKF-1 TaxID=1196324 RepID=I8UC47_9BACL|nr:hypothetical protein [Fictibacillus macauensis]EIT84470.1 hypothetical protein A374_15132 [Fictibacillus macauensis ZFHKF-1]